MKQFFLFLFAGFFALSVSAQSEKYLNAMQPKVDAIDTTYSLAGLQDIANAFERIAEAEKTQWLPYYYSALANVNAGYMMMGSDFMNDNYGKIDPIADKAEKLLFKAEELNKDNSEIWVVKRMIITLRASANAMQRYAMFADAAQALETAKKLNPENPRIYLLEGQTKFYTPEQFGGSKEEAKKLFEEAKKKYEAFKPESSIHPNWGKGQVEYFMSQIK